MEKAKQLAKEIQEQSFFEPIERTEEHMEGLKPAINNLLHVYLPNDVTIRESETIAMVINEMIWNPSDFVKGPIQESIKENGA